MLLNDPTIYKAAAFMCCLNSHQCKMLQANGDGNDIISGLKAGEIKFDSKCAGFVHLSFIREKLQEHCQSIFNNHCKDLLAYKAENGHCDVHRSHALGNFTSDARKGYKYFQMAMHTTNGLRMSHERIKQLLDIGFSFIALVERHEERFQELLKFKTKNGHCTVTKANPGLFKWCANVKSGQDIDCK